MSVCHPMIPMCYLVCDDERSDSQKQTFLGMGRNEVQTKPKSRSKIQKNGTQIESHHGVEVPIKGPPPLIQQQRANNTAKCHTCHSHMSLSIHV